MQVISPACTEKPSCCIQSYFSSLISCISITFQHLDTKIPTVITADNVDKIGKPNAINIMRYIFRLGSFTVQKYIGNKGYWHSEIFPQTGTNDS
ncbi:MAG: hypothetical protein MJK12_06265 [Colwellia sp.]|nr:hypothetical protein [Colwellia sp.]